MGEIKAIPKNEADYDLSGLVNMIEQAACSYSKDKRSHIAQNTAFEILFKGKHPLDVIGEFPEEIKEALSGDSLTKRTTYKNISLSGKDFISIQILPIYRDFIIKFKVSKAFSADYKQIFKIVFDNSPMGILLVDKNLKFIAVNKAICDMTGYTPHELKQKTFIDITHPDDLDRNLPLTKKLYSEEIDTFSIQKRYIKKDGNIIWVNLVTSLTKDLNGEFLGGLGVVEDITLRRNIEDQRDQFMHSLREKNKEIIDSLAYASNIQGALLPRGEDFAKFFPKHFIYYKPRDIVGGDFYWIRSHKNKVYFAVADCTGHGVPGAFISLIGNYRLNLVFEKYKSQDPGLILQRLNNIIAYSFRSPYYSVSHHGMDIAMCCYDLETHELEYSGANNSMIVLRENIESGLSNFLKEENHYRFAAPDLLEIRANKQSIGTYSNGIKFKSHKLKIQKGDRIYLFSDGYADQFGGERAKKLKMAEFRRLLSKERNSDFRNQSSVLHEFRKNWQGDLQQVDDICILGIEF